MEGKPALPTPSPNLHTVHYFHQQPTVCMFNGNWPLTFLNSIMKQLLR